MQKIKRTVAVTTLTKKGFHDRNIVGNFNVMKEVKAGWRVEGTRMVECEMSIDKFYANADSQIPISNPNDYEVEIPEGGDI